MLYEKKPARREKTFTQPLVLITIMLSAQVAFAVLTTKFPGTFWDIKLIDIVNAVAQVATAGAFYIVFRQYKENKQKDRQTALSVECRALVKSMSSLIVKVTDGVASPSDYERDFTRLCNQAADFREIFTAMREDIIKGISRMHWQEMYFNEFRPRMQYLSLFVFLPNAGIDKDLVHARETRLYHTIPEGLSQDENFSFRVDMVISDPEIADKLDTSKWYWVHHMYEEFFNNKNLNDLLYGTMNKADMYLQAPLLYSLYKLKQKQGLGKEITPVDLRY
ncbi:hypothetical protein [Pseudomonas syringae]|uniref:Phage abortive infection protein n=1 Tax=Pseudomonas syringae TaxID=317 RepID=A0A085V486_PSESX|nr:hypothetical protein [Pseudomonas syringae]KFE50249.1 hypothetical protein IV02_17620 [Pseudomonas syringae]